MKGVDQFVDGDHAVFFGNIGDMGITCGGIGAGVAKQCLNMAKA